MDRTALFATIDAVKGGPELANFQFRVTNRWVNGTPQPVNDPRLLHEMTHKAAWKCLLPGNDPEGRRKSPPTPVGARVKC